MASTDKSTSSLDTLSVGFPAAIFMFIITVFLFMYRDTISRNASFTTVLWVGIPLVTFVIAFSITITSQYMRCNKTDVGKAALGALCSLVAVLIGLGVSSITFCRIPVASVFAPLFIGQKVDVTKNKENTTINSLRNSSSKPCCTPQLSLETIERDFPMVSGFSYGFYILFSMLFGTTFGSGIASIC